MTAQIQSLLRTARREIGVREATGKNDGIPSERYQLNPFWKPGRAEKYRVRADEWCVLFQLWVRRAAGYPLESSERQWWEWASVTNLNRHFSELGFRLGFAVLPEPGDYGIIRSRPGGVGSDGQHIFLVDRVLSDGYIATIEGNSGNAVAQGRRKRLDPEHGQPIQNYLRIPFPYP